MVLIVKNLRKTAEDPAADEGWVVVGPRSGVEEARRAPPAMFFIGLDLVAITTRYCLLARGFLNVKMWTNYWCSSSPATVKEPGA